MGNGTNDTSGLKRKSAFVASDSTIKAMKPPTLSTAKKAFSFKATKPKSFQTRESSFPLEAQTLSSAARQI